MTNAVNLASAAGTGFAFRNRIINGDMRIDQRSISSTTSSGFVVDRWIYGGGGTGTISLARSTVAPPGFTNSIGMTVTASATPNGSTYHELFQKVEGLNIADLGFGTANAQPVTISFWVRSSVTGTFCTSLHNGVVNRSIVREYTINAANTWEYKTVTVPGDTTGTWATDNSTGMYVLFTVADGLTKASSTNTWLAGGFYATSNLTQLTQTNGATFYITGVQLEVGSVSNPVFERRPYGFEDALCKRYWLAVNSQEALGVFQGAANAVLWNNFPVEMRSSPTVTFPASLTNVIDQWGTASRTPTALNATTTRKSMWFTGTGMSGSTIGNPAVWIGGTIQLNAEL